MYYSVPRRTAGAGKASEKKLMKEKVLRFYMSYILPAIIVVVYLKGYYDTFKPKGTGYLVGWMIFACVLLLAIFGIANYKKKDA